jgi:transmembrane sensor
METSSSTRERIAAEAVEWFLQLQKPVQAAKNRQAFSEWLQRSPIHIEEYLAVSSAWALVDVPNENEFRSEILIEAACGDVDTSNVVGYRSGVIWREPGTDRSSRLRTNRWRELAAAATVMLGISVWFGYQRWQQPPTEFATTAGEQRSISLADGSVVFMNANSQVRLRWTSAERRIALTKGEARFQVAKNPQRPFIVVTSQASVRAVGTIFSVTADHKSTQVTVIEGRVKVSAQPEESPFSQAQHLWSVGTTEQGAAATIQLSIELAAGEGAAIDSEGRIGPDAQLPNDRLDTLARRQLVFRDEPLQQAVSKFNRFHAAPMVIDDPQLAAMKINGVFDSNDPEALVAYLKAFESVHAQYAADGSLHLSSMAVTPKTEK